MTIQPPVGDGGAAVVEQEVLYTNEGGTALTRPSSSPSWANDLQFELSRALTDNDDGKTLRLDMSFVASGTERHFRVDLAETFFHHLEAWTDNSSKALPADFVSFSNVRMRSGDTALNNIQARPWIVARNRASNGNDIFRLQLCDGNTQVVWTDIFVTISLVP